MPTASGMPEMPTGQWDAEFLDGVWYFVRWFLAENQMWIMIVVGFFIAVGVSALILNIFTHDEEEEEYEIRRL